jgi:hypothetical protein
MYLYNVTCLLTTIPQTGIKCEISDSHGDEYEDKYVFCDVAPCGLVEIDPEFQRCLEP